MTTETETTLERWQRLEALMTAAQVCRGLRIAVQSLEVLAAYPDHVGDEARRAIALVLAELDSDPSAR